MHSQDGENPAIHAAWPRLLPMRRRRPTGRVCRDLLCRAVVDEPRLWCWQARRVYGGNEDKPERSQTQTHPAHTAQAEPRATLTRNTRMVFRELRREEPLPIYFLCLHRFVFFSFSA